jgi:hypothetical protein
MVLEAKETEVGQDPVGMMFKNCVSGIKSCGISKFIQSALKSGMAAFMCGKTAKRNASSESCAGSDEMSARRQSSGVG